MSHRLLRRCSYLQSDPALSFFAICAGWRDADVAHESGWELMAITQERAGSELRWSIFRGSTIVCNATFALTADATLVRGAIEASPAIAGLADVDSMTQPARSPALDRGCRPRPCPP